jgi:hypothetical protein
MLRRRTIILFSTMALMVTGSGLAASAGPTDSERPWACAHVQVLDGIGACVYNPVQF